VNVTDEFDADLEWTQELHRRRVAEVDREMPTRYMNVELQSDVCEWADRLAAGNAGNLVLVGPTGVGKTTACWGALRHAVASGFADRWRFWHCADLAAALRPGDVTEDVIVEAREAGLLILDDLAVTGMTPWQETQLIRIVHTRWERQRPILASSNVRQLGKALGERIASRLSDGATVVTVHGEDHRRSR
jgi:DNA replication protein DnaC